MERVFGRVALIADVQHTTGTRANHVGGLVCSLSRLRQKAIIQHGRERSVAVNEVGVKIASLRSEHDSQNTAE